MAFHIEIEPQAFEDLDALVAFIKGENRFETAEKWLRGMLRSIRSLEQMPARCPIADESKALPQEVHVCYMEERAARIKSISL
jgi:plasmid stabilization system protein ParE